MTSWMNFHLVTKDSECREFHLSPSIVPIHSPREQAEHPPRNNAELELNRGDKQGDWLINWLLDWLINWSINWLNHFSLTKWFKLITNCLMLAGCSFLRGPQSECTSLWLKHMEWLMSNHCQLMSSTNANSRMQLHIYTVQQNKIPNLWWRLILSRIPNYGRS